MNPEPRLPLGHDAYNFARMLVPNVVLAWPSEHSLDGWQMNGLVMPGRDGHARLQPAAARQAAKRPSTVERRRKTRDCEACVDPQAWPRGAIVGVIQL